MRLSNRDLIDGLKWQINLLLLGFLIEQVDFCQKYWFNMVWELAYELTNTSSDEVVRRNRNRWGRLHGGKHL